MEAINSHSNLFNSNGPNFIAGNLKQALSPNQLNYKSRAEIATKNDLPDVVQFKSRNHLAMKSEQMPSIGTKNSKSNLNVSQPLIYLGQSQLRPLAGLTSNKIDRPS